MGNEVEDKTKRNEVDDKWKGYEIQKIMGKWLR